MFPLPSDFFSILLGPKAIEEKEELIVLEGINAGYDRRGQVLYDVNAVIPRSSIVLVTGRNGAGKTTLLRTIAGIGDSHVLRGGIRYGGRDITRLAGHERARMGLVYMAQEERVFESLSISKHFQLVDSNASHTDARDVILEAFSPLREKWTERAGTLSGGQQQMLAAALAFARAASCASSLTPVLLLDEPTLGLQPSVVQDLLRLMQYYQRERRVAIILTGKEPGAERIATESYHIEAGRFRLTER